MVSVMQNPRTGKVKWILHSDRLPQRARWDHLASSGFPALVPQGESSLFVHIIDPILTELVRSRGLYIGLVPFCVLIMTMTKFSKLIGYQLSWFQHSFTSTLPPFIITQKELGQYPAILAKHWPITHNTIITIPPMELSSEVEADLAKPRKAKRESHVMPTTSFL